MEDDLQKLLRLTEENNAMLKEILAYVQKIQDKDYLANDYSREIKQCNIPYGLGC